MESIIPVRPGRSLSPASAFASAGAGSASPGVLTVCDLSAAAIDATWRAAMVARELGVPLRVLHPLIGGATPLKHGGFIEELRAEIPRRMAIEVDFETVEHSALDAAVAAARHAALFVMPTQRGNPLREWIMGTQAERLVRLSRSPVLVVKQPALHPYRRLLVAAALEGADAQLLELSAAVAGNARLELLHVLDTDEEIVLRELDASTATVRARRQYRAGHAHAALRKLLEPVTASVHAVTSVEFGHGAAAVVDRAQASHSDLVVIGKRRRGLMADYLLGGVTRRVLAATRCDVLVLPIRNPDAAARAHPGRAAIAPLQEDRLRERAATPLLHRS